MYNGRTEYDEPSVSFYLRLRGSGCKDAQSGEVLLTALAASLYDT